MVGKGKGYSLVPFDPKAEEFIRSLKSGEAIWLEVRRVRNPRFHRKFFALLGLAFDAWEPGDAAAQYKGQAIAKNADRFRDDVLILAGHYDATYNINGDVRLRAKSISFASMDNDEFEVVYRDVLNVVWEKVLRNARFDSKEEVDAVINQLLSFE